MTSMAVAAVVSLLLLAILAVRRFVRRWREASRLIAADKAETERIRAELADEGNGSAL